MLPLTGLLLGAFLVADVVANTHPDGTLGQVAAFVPPLSPMVVPARMVLGNMGIASLMIALGLDVLATAGTILLAARVYERAILRTGAPVKLRRALAIHSSLLHRAEHGSGGTQAMTERGTHKGPAADATETRVARITDFWLRMGAVVFVIAGAVIGFSHPIAIVLVAIGVVLLILDQGLRYWPRKPAH